MQKIYSVNVKRKSFIYIKLDNSKYIIININEYLMLININNFISLNKY